MPREPEDRAEAEDRESLDRMEEPPVSEEPEEPAYTPAAVSQESEEPAYTPSPSDSESSVAVSEEPEEPVYTPEEYQLAQEIKAVRLYKEENNRPPQTAGDLSYFLMKANIERPLRPDDEDLQAARRKLEAAGS
jgi:hypothetical protein